MDDDRLTEKIQVLLSKRDIELLNNIMLGKAIKIGKPPSPLSTFIRAIIRKYVDEETKEPFSYSEEEAKKVLKERMEKAYLEKLRKTEKNNEQ